MRRLVTHWRLGIGQRLGLATVVRSSVRARQLDEVMHMAGVQQQFENFHSAIRMDYDMASELAEKRDAVLQRIKKYLTDHKLPVPRELLQLSLIHI